ncbi:sigma 54-interacting transcriptional regulator [Acidisarcina polymorpha]|nr:sigma 54-interacting transcriptional regulator [Acidisarcina polymorpha]
MDSQSDKQVLISSQGAFPVDHGTSFLHFTQQLNQYRDVETLLQALPSKLHSLSTADTFMVVYERELASSKEVSPDSGATMNGIPGHFVGSPSYCWVHESQRPLVIQSLARERRFGDAFDWFQTHGYRSLCILPLQTSLRRLGIICAARSFEKAFSEEDLSLLSLAADHAALAIHARLNFDASERARLQLENERTKLKLILDLNNSVVSNLNLKELIQAISPNIRSVMQLDAVALMLPTPSKEGLEVYALDFPDGKGHIRAGAVLSPEAVAARVFENGKPWVGEISEEQSPYFGGTVAIQEGFKALSLLPLVRGGRSLGVLAVARLKRNSFTREDVDFLLQIAGQLAIAIDNALAYRRISELSDQLAQEKLYLEDEIRSELNFEEIVGNSAALRKVLRQVEAVAPTNSTVLIYGETGSGKELIARAVHKFSQRSSHAFVKLNCAAIPTGLLESELFGHEKGAFTGAISQRIGRFELASQGTIFLDEVGEIPLELQPKLLRVLQEREFERLGSSRTLHTAARLIAATNRDLYAMVEAQRFRTDLFYRLNVFPIYVPSLRERTEDIPFLVRHFAQHFARLMKKQIDTISADTMNCIVRYPWPGNIRELQNVIERAVILSTGRELKVPVADLKSRPTESNGVTTLEEIERRHILHVLEQSNWVFSGPNGAAARLGIKRPTLQFRMRKLGIARPNQR